MGWPMISQRRLSVLSYQDVFCLEVFIWLEKPHLLLLGLILTERPLQAFQILIFPLLLPHVLGPARKCFLPPVFSC